jgi:hypothetical protein
LIKWDNIYTQIPWNWKAKYHLQQNKSGQGSATNLLTVGYNNGSNHTQNYIWLTSFFTALLSESFSSTKIWVVGSSSLVFNNNIFSAQEARLIRRRQNPSPHSLSYHNLFLSLNNPLETNNPVLGENKQLLT